MALIELLKIMHADLISADRCKTCGNTAMSACDDCIKGSNYKWHREAEYNKTVSETKENDILKREYSEQFDRERKARVEVSFYKYGSARDNFASGRVDAIATAERCIEAFKKYKNTEHLVDAANYLMFRYKFPMPGEYFKPTDSGESVGTVGTAINMENNA